MKLNELFTRGEGMYFVAYKENLWLFQTPEMSSDDDEAVFTNMRSALSKYDITIEDDQDWYEISSMSRDSEVDPSLIAGSIHNNKLVIDGEGNFRHSVASTTLLKVMDELNIKTVSINSIIFDDEGNDHEIGYEHSRDEFMKPLDKKTFYHGTSLKYLPDILKKGIMPKPEQTNYKNIAHEGKIFFTLNPERSEFHAHTSAQITDSYPVIVKFNVPDVSKIVLDYDVAIELYGKEHYQTVTLGYDTIHDIAVSGTGHDFSMPLRDFVPTGELQQIRDKSSLNTKLGVFGYKGRVPAKFIQSVLVNPQNIINSVYVEYNITDRTVAISDMEEYTIPEFIRFVEHTREEVEQDMDDWDDDE